MARQPAPSKAKAKPKPKTKAPTVKARRKNLKYDPPTEEEQEEVDEEDEDEEEGEEESNVGDTSMEGDISEKIKAAAGAIKEKYRVEARRCIDRAETHRDGLMTRTRHMVETTHPAEISGVLVRLLKDLDAQDTIINQAWEEIAPLDEGMLNTIQQHYTDLEGHAEDVEKIRKGCMATIAKQASDEAMAVDIVHRAMAGSGVAKKQKLEVTVDSAD